METLIYIFSERLFSLFCHQQNDLLMHIDGYSLPFCYRCGFIYIGIFTAFLVLIVYQKNMPSWSVGLLFVSILFGEWFISNIGLYHSTVLSRSISGFIGGVGAVFLLYHYEWKINTVKIILLILVPILSLFIYSFYTAILTLILVSFIIFWVWAIHIAQLIILSFKTKGVSYEIKRQN